MKLYSISALFISMVSASSTPVTPEVEALIKFVEDLKRDMDSIPDWKLEEVLEGLPSYVFELEKDSEPTSF